MYRENCAICYGLPGRSETAIHEGEFPAPPHLFQVGQMASGNAEGVTFWKGLHGIRLSGMPGFAGTLSDTERWQVTKLLADAGRLPAAVRNSLMERRPCNAGPSGELSRNEK